MRILAAALFLGAPVLALATPTDFNFKDVEVQSICQTIGVLGKFNVVVDQSISRARLTLSLKQVEPLDALNDVARQTGAAVSRIRYNEGTSVFSYMIGRVDESKTQARTTRTILVRYASASQLAKSLGARIEAITGERPAIDDRTNRLIVTGTLAELGQVEQLVEDLDRAVPVADLSFVVSEGGGGMSLELWSADASATQGRVGRFTLNSGVRPASDKTTRLSDLEGKFQTRVSPEGLCSVALNVTGSIEKDGVKHAVHWSTEVQVADKGSVECGAVGLPTGEKLELRVTLRGLHQTVAPESSGDLDLDEPKPVPSPAPSPSGGDLDLEGI